MALVDKLSGEKPHSSITDWVEVLSSDRYDELSLDGIPELVDSINLQGHQGTTEASRAIRKKLKYGNVHRQIRALVILRALTDNAGKGFHLHFANSQLIERLQAMATDVRPQFQCFLTARIYSTLESRNSCYLLSTHGQSNTRWVQSHVGAIKMVRTVPGVT